VRGLELSMELGENCVSIVTMDVFYYHRNLVFRVASFTRDTNSIANGYRMRSTSDQIESVIMLL